MVSLEWTVNAYQHKVLNLMTKDFYPNGCGLFYNDSASIHKARGLTERFDEDANDVNYTLRPSRSPHLNPYGRFADL